MTSQYKFIRHKLSILFHTALTDGSIYIRGMFFKPRTPICVFEKQKRSGVFICLLRYRIQFDFGLNIRHILLIEKHCLIPKQARIKRFKCQNKPIPVIAILWVEISCMQRLIRHQTVSIRTI